MRSRPAARAWPSWTAGERAGPPCSPRRTAGPSSSGREAAARSNPGGWATATSPRTTSGIPGLPDVLQLGTKGGLFYKGKAPGEFAPPIRTRAFAGEKECRPCVGDFDGDGLPDVFVLADEVHHFWQNEGNARFSDRLDRTGSLEYIIKRGAISAQSGDFCNGGHQDIFIAYDYHPMSPQIFFNRGFRSFGHAYYLDIAQDEVLPDAKDGQQAGCLGDFNGDGALDMAVVLAEGDVWLLPRKVEKGNNRCAVVSLPLSAPTAGPVNVLAYSGRRLLGAWSIRAGEPGAIIGARLPCTITLKWTWPGGDPQQKRVDVKYGPVRVSLGEK